jgi:hypothetical protein
MCSEMHVQIYPQNLMIRMQLEWLYNLGKFCDLLGT